MYIVIAYFSTSIQTLLFEGVSKNIKQTKKFEILCLSLNYPHILRVYLTSKSKSKSVRFLTWFIKRLVSSFPLSMTYIDRWATQLSLVPLLNVFSIIGTYSYTKYLRSDCINIVASKPEVHKSCFILYISI